MIRARLLSYIYKKERARLIKHVYQKQITQQKPKDLEEVITLGDQKLRQLPSWTCSFSIPEHIGVRMHDLYFPSPLTLSSFKAELDIIEIWLKFGLGGACLKTILPHPSEGNKKPRLQECTLNRHVGFINSLGLPGKGVDSVIKELESSSLLHVNKPIGLSIGGNTADEYKYTFEKLYSFIQTQQALQHYYELNISCPNTTQGKDLSYHPSILADILLFMRSKTNSVIGIKVSPDLQNPQLTLIAKTISLIPKTFINIGNTTHKTCEQVNLPNNALSTGGGGLSGPALYARTLEMTLLLAPSHVPLIATGGICSAQHVKELRTAGATLIGMAYAVVTDPYCIPMINNALAHKNTP